MATDRKKRNAADRRPRGVFLRKLLLITTGGFVLRLIVAAEIAAINGGRNSVFTPSTLSDLATYMCLAHELLDGAFSGPFYYQPFYYAVFLPAAYFVSGGSIWFVIVLQALLGAATVWIAGLAAARLFGRSAGYTAALLVAISTPLLLYTPFHQNETLQTFNLMFLFYLVLRATEVWTPRRWGAAGGMTGIAILTRGNIWILVPGIVAVLLLSGRRAEIQSRRIVATLLIYVALLLAVQLPFIIHNSRELGRLSGPSTAADAVLALGNSPEAPAGGRNPGLPAGPMEYPESYRRMMERAGAGISVPRQMLEYLLEEPGAFLELQFRKLLLFWDAREIPNNVSLYGEGEHSLVLKWLLPGRSLVVIALGVAGLLIFAGRTWRKRPPGLLLLYYFIVAYWGAVALFYILSRFRAPVLPFLAIAGGGFVGWALRRRRLTPPAERRRPLLFGGAALLAGVWLTASSYDFYRENLEAAIHRMVRPAGTRIDLGGSTIERIDHGPFTFGGWSEALLEPGTRLGKEFAEAPDGPVELELGVLTLVPGRITLTVNGTSRTVEAPDPGLHHFKLELPTFPAGTAEITVQTVTGEHHLLFDAQRDYGRSSYNGTPLSGEWIIRLRHNRTESKQP